MNGKRVRALDKKKYGRGVCVRGGGTYSLVIGSTRTGSMQVYRWLPFVCGDGLTDGVVAFCCLTFMLVVDGSGGLGAGGVSVARVVVVVAHNYDNK